MATNDYNESERYDHEEDREGRRSRGSDRDRREMDRDRNYRGRHRRDIDHDDPESERFRKLFIGGLSYNTTDSTLQAYFEEYGELVDCIVMKEPQSKSSRGFGFVTYRTSKMVDDCLAARPHRIDGRDVDIKRAMPRNENKSLMSSDSRDSTRKLFVGGLADKSTETSIRDAFEEFGNVDQVDLMMDKVTGRHRGFAFITFSDSDAVDYCVIKKFFEVDGKTVEVKKAESRQSVKNRSSMMTQMSAKMASNKDSGMGMGMSNMGGNTGMGMGMGNMGGNMGGMGQMGNMMGMGGMGQMGQMGNMGMGQMGNMGAMGMMGQMGNMAGQMGNMGQMGQMGMGNMGQMGNMAGQMGNMGGQMGNMGASSSSSTMGMGDNKALTSGSQDDSTSSSGGQQGQNPMAGMMNMMGITPQQFQMMANMMTMMGMMNPQQMSMMANQMGNQAGMGQNQSTGNQMGMGQQQIGMGSTAGGSSTQDSMTAQASSFTGQQRNFSGQGAGGSWGTGGAQFGENYGEGAAGPVKGAMSQRDQKPYSRGDGYR